MIGNIGMHRADDAKFVGRLGNIWEEFGNFQPAFAVFLELERGSESDAGGAFCFKFEGDLLSGVLREFGLGVEGVDLGRAAIHEEVDDGFGLAAGLRRAGGEGADRLTGERRDGKSTESHSAALEKFAARFDKAPVSKVMVSAHGLIDVEKFITQEESLRKLGEWRESGAGEVGFGIRDRALLIRNSWSPMKSVECNIVATIDDEPDLVSGLDFEVIDFGRDALGRLNGPLF